MFENTIPEKNKQIVQPHNFPPFSPLNENTTLRGNVKQLGKYQFSFDQKLGSGLTSDAYIGINKQTRKLVCVKIIDRQTFKDQNQKALLAHQIKCQQKLQSQYIVNILDVYDTNSFCFIVTQLCQDGDLFKLIQFSRTGLHQNLVIRLGTNLAYALLKMKQCKIIHRDIKSENIMLSQGISKLGDFGFAIQEKDLKEKEYFSVGSPLYMPLQSLEQNKYSYQSDIFSFGIVLYEMLHAQSPWQSSDEKELIHKIKTQKIVYKNGISQRLKSIINSCLELQASKRSKIQFIVTELQSLLEAQQLKQKLKVQPNQVKTAIQIKS